MVWTINAAHTYTEEGTYSYTVTVTDDGGASTVVAGSAIIADAALAPSNPQPTVSATEGANTGSVPVATFTDGNPTATVADFTATIDWGDGSPTSLGSVTEAAGVFTVSGAHTYSEESTNLVPPTYPIVVNIVDDGGSRLTTTTTASVADAPLAPSNPQPTVSATEGANTGSVPVATFTDGNPTATVADFTATIDWGDGSPTSLGSVTEAAGVFTVSGAHTYSEESTNLVPPTYPIVVNIVDDGGSRLTTTTTASVADAPLAPSNPQPTVSATEGANTGSVPVATFTDGNPTATVADFTATIDWGDGSPTSLGSVTEAAGVFTVSGAHTYSEESTNLVPPTYPIVVNIVDDGGSRLTTTTTASVADAPLAPSNPQPMVSATEGANTGSVPVATFTDGNPTATVADFTATIDWGDGSPTSLGSVTEAAGVFTVSVRTPTARNRRTSSRPPTRSSSISWMSAAAA